MKLSLMIWGLAALTAGGLGALPQEYISETTVCHDFHVAEPFTDVRRVMVRSDSTKKVVAMSDAELIDEDWERVKLSVAQLLKRDWTVKAKGKLRVRTHDRYVGSDPLLLEQTVVIQPDQLVSQTELAESHDRLRDYLCCVEMKADGEGTLVRTKLQLAVKTEIPPVVRKFVDRRVQEAAKKCSSRMENCLRQVIAENVDKELPLRMRG